MVELVIVIAISGIIAGMVAVFLLRPIQGYDAQVRRAELVDAAEMALRRITRDIRRALPNSIRIDGTNRIIEMLNTLDGARYREGPGNIGHNHGPPQYRLSFTGADANGFNVTRAFQNITLPFVSAAHRLAVYSQDPVETYTDAVAVGGARVITAPGVFLVNDDDGVPSDEQSVTVAPAQPAFQFRRASPNQRVYIVDMPITYLCNTGARTITRYENYAIVNPQPVIAPPLANGSLLTDRVANCVFSYAAGTSERAGLVTLDITINDVPTGETVRLLHQVHVHNVP
jgi:MSHA biogenesis protein MshO